LGTSTGYKKSTASRNLRANGSLKILISVTWSREHSSKPHPHLAPLASLPNLFSKFHDERSAKDALILRKMTDDKIAGVAGPRVLIIGAGITGLLIAQGLKRVRALTPHSIALAW
jgi:hypothetical protein